MEGPGSGTSLEELVREHAALRRVAVLVAREPSPADGGLSELRDLARGSHPSVLTDRGLAMRWRGS